MIFTKWHYGLLHAYIFLGTSHILSGRFHIHFLTIMLQNKRWSQLASSLWQYWALQREKQAVLTAHLIMALGGNCLGDCSWE